MRACSLTSRSALETRDAGARLGRLLRPGDFICLKGELGAGKTTFVQGAAEGLCSEEAATSPSFAIVNEYHGRITLYHVDLYRLSGPADLEDIGFRELAGDGAEEKAGLAAKPSAAIVEWPERAGDELPVERLEIVFEHLGGDTRKITVTAAAPEYERFLEAICQPR